LRVAFSILLLWLAHAQEAPLAESNITSELTFYGAGDNCPPGGAIAYPIIHQEAGGNGTWTNPITCASAPNWLSPGSKIYIPHYKKYFIMEDSCEECITDWVTRGKYHVDGWLGPDTIEHGSTDCEVQLTLSATTITLNPADNHAVDTTPLFSCNSQGTCTCIETVTSPCVNDYNVCGNSCQLPSSMSCQNAANMFLLTLSQFEQLNKGLCSSGSTMIPAGKTVCQAGSCGGP